MCATFVWGICGRRIVITLHVNACVLLHHRLALPCPDAFCSVALPCVPLFCTTDLGLQGVVAASLLGCLGGLLAAQLLHRAHIWCRSEFFGVFQSCVRWCVHHDARHQNHQGLNVVVGTAYSCDVEHVKQRCQLVGIVCGVMLNGPGTGSMLRHVCAVLRCCMSACPRSNIAL